jgi:hypothetical protein
MDCQTAHRDDIASLPAADLNCASVGVALDLSGGDTPQTKRAAKRHQRPIVSSTIIEVKAHRYHASKNGLWRFDVVCAVLHAPNIEPWNLHALGNRNGSVLMPRDCPVHARRLIEVENANSSHALAHEMRRDLRQRITWTNQVPDYRGDSEGSSPWAMGDRELWQAPQEHDDRVGTTVPTMATPSVAKLPSICLVTQCSPAPPRAARGSAGSIGLRCRSCPR